MKTTPAYSREIIRQIKKAARKQVKNCLSVSHIYPRALCVAKPAPGCAVFATPWMDAEKQVRDPKYSSFETVYGNVSGVQFGDWCSLAYISTESCGQTYVIDL